MKYQMTGTVFVLVLLLAVAAQPAAGQAVAGAGDHLDPTTGLPAPAEQWLSSDWAGPTGKIPDVVFDSLPVSEVANRLRAQFKGGFDIIIPNEWKSSGTTDIEFDPSAVLVRLQLHDVSLFQLFGAMNIEFEVENKPVRWELRNNVQRPIAVLHVIPALVPGVFAAANHPIQEKKSMVFFVGGPGWAWIWGYAWRGNAPAF